MKKLLPRIPALLPLLCALVGLAGCDTAEMQPWHTEILKSDFSATNSREMDSFTDYLRLEDDVFTEMEQRIYAVSATGAQHALERYSKGSLADPGRRQPNWNRSFELASDTPVGGVLLLHGMSDSPYSLRALGETLQQRGYYVVGLRMPGHGTLPSGLLDLQWRDMAAVVKIGMAHLAARVPGKPIHIIGYSTGAALALDYALETAHETSHDNANGHADGNAHHLSLPAPATLVLISPAIAVRPSAALAKWGRRLARIPGLRRLAWLELEPEFDPYKYNSFTANAAEQVYELTESVARRIAARATTDQALPPILVLKSAVDATVSDDAVVDRLLLKLPAGRNAMVVFDINRFGANSSLLVQDPGPFTDRLIADKQLPFALTLVTNSSAANRSVTAYTKRAFTAGASTAEELGQRWPKGVFSLSHVALPFPADDPLYGQQPPEDNDELFLGQQALQGELGVLKIPANFLLRLRHNPFYEYEQARVLDWIK